MNANRVYKGRAVSLTDAEYARAAKRAQSLKPKVSSFSNYIQQLIALDLQQGLLGPQTGSSTISVEGTDRVR